MMVEYVVMRSSKRFTSRFRWDVCKAFGPKDKTRGMVGISSHVRHRDAKAEADRLNALLAALAEKGGGE